MDVGQAFEAVLAFFEAEQWRVSRRETRPAVDAEFRGRHGQWTCHAQVIEANAQFVCHSVCPETAPPDRRQAMAEFLTRANYGLTIGNFEMSFDRGTIHFKTGIDFEGDELTPALVKQVVYPNVITMDRYLPGIRSVIAGTATPREAIAQVEGSG